MHTVYCKNKGCIYEYKGRCYRCYLGKYEIHLDPEGTCLDFIPNENEDDKNEV